MKRVHAVFFGTIACLTTLAYAQDAAQPFLGRWALTIPGGGAGWLGITNDQGYLDGEILWGGGSVVPVESVYIDGDTLVVTRHHDVQRKDPAGKVIDKQIFTETISATVDDDAIALTRVYPHTDGIGVDRDTFIGKRIPDLPPAPDLSKAQYGDPITLFNGQNLEGWELTDPNQVNGWRVENGLLINEPVQKEGQPHISYGNLRTQQEFEDFNLTLEINVPEKGNSGIYLRGIYEVQVADTHGKPLNAHNMGGIYSRITPAVAAEKPAGEWQHYDITLLDRHVTVKLNGKTIIDNQPLLGITGGALTSDEFRPGPIYLQGDHTAVQYRNIVLRPIVK